MKRFGWVLILFLLSQSCISGNHLITSKKLERLTAGMTEERVEQIAGPADQRFDFDRGRFVLYYRKENSVMGSTDLERDYTAVSFEDGRVITIGQDLKDIWESPKNGQDGKVLSSISAEERRARIKALENKVRPIPVSDAKQNLKLYQALLALDPLNRRYKQKVAFYRQRIKLQAESSEENTSKPLLPVIKKAPVKPKRTVSSQKTRIEPIQIEAVKIREGVYFVWIKNSTDRNLTIGLDTFAVLDTEKKLIRFNLSPELISEIEPDETASGELWFVGTAKPLMLVFTHANTEPIVKMLN